MKPNLTRRWKMFGFGGLSPPPSCYLKSFLLIRSSNLNLGNPHPCRLLVGVIFSISRGGAFLWRLLAQLHHLQFGRLQSARAESGQGGKAARRSPARGGARAGGGGGGLRLGGTGRLFPSARFFGLLTTDQRNALRRRLWRTWRAESGWPLWAPREQRREPGGWRRAAPSHGKIDGGGGLF